MENKNEKTAALINNLIEINNDRIDGYEKAAKEVKSKDLESLFVQLADESRQLRSELISEIVNHGGAPPRVPHFRENFSAWMDVKAALTNNDKKAIISSCEFGEDAAVEAYDDVLNSEDLTSHTKELIKHQRIIIKKSHDHIKVLRDGVKEPHHL